MPRPLYKRLYVYQKERFPLAVHFPLISAFCFSVIGYSSACQMKEGLIPLWQIMCCIFTNFVLFFLLRVADEHKDNADDMLYRKYLPVPRGLVSLKELRMVAYPLLIIVTLINIIWFAKLLPFYLLMMVYLLLMRYEFFIPEWLKNHQIAYITSHMFIIPLADIYASAYDWSLTGGTPPMGLFYFFCISYISGIIMEVGRKMRVPETEEHGVISYTALWGTKNATITWAVLVAGNFILAHIAIRHAGGNSIFMIILNIVFVVAIFPAFYFLYKKSKQATKLIEIMSLLWAFGMYLILGSTHYLS